MTDDEESVAADVLPVATADEPAAPAHARHGRARLHVRRLELAPVLTAADVAALLGVQSVRAVRALIVREGIPHVRLGKRLVVLQSSLVSWLAAREETGAERLASIRSAADRLRGARRRCVRPSAETP